MSSEGFSQQFDPLDYSETLRGLRAGQKLLRRYVLKRKLGRGGMGVVWLAFDEVLEREIAFKFLPDAVSHDQGALDDLKRETRRSLELTHPNIIRIYDFVSDEECAGITMEFVDGDTLSNLRAAQPQKIFEVAELQVWLLQLCQALEYAHEEAEMAHRDLKPANLMINRQGRLKVADFGISGSVSNTMASMTAASSGSGTPFYMSPQQAMGDKPSVLDDIYSAGATIYELLTSKPPYYQGDIKTQVQAKDKVPPPMTQRRKELKEAGQIGETQPIPKRWESVIADCLSKDPAKRPQSARELAEKLALLEAKTAKVRKPRATKSGGGEGPVSKTESPSQQIPKTDAARADTDRIPPGATPSPRKRVAKPRDTQAKGKTDVPGKPDQTAVPEAQTGMPAYLTPPEQAGAPTATSPKAGVTESPPAPPPKTESPKIRKPGGTTVPGRQAQPAEVVTPITTPPAEPLEAETEPEAAYEAPPPEKKSNSLMLVGLLVLLAAVAYLVWQNYSSRPAQSAQNTTIITKPSDGETKATIEAARAKKVAEETKKQLADAQAAAERNAQEIAKLEADRKKLEAEAKAAAAERARAEKEAKDAIAKANETATRLKSDEAKKMAAELKAKEEARLKEDELAKQRAAEEKRLADAKAAAMQKEKEAADARVKAAEAAAKKAQEEAAEARRLATMRGGVIIRTTPDKAKVTLNNETKLSPAIFTNLPIMTGQAVIELDGYNPMVVSVAVVDQKEKKLFSTNSYPVTLVRSQGTLELHSIPEPADFTLLLDDKVVEKGKTPIRNRALPTGNYMVKLSYQEYATDFMFTLRRDQQIAHTQPLPFGYAHIVTDPPGATISHNGRTFANPTPVTGIFPPGESEIVLRRDGYKDATNRFTVRVQQTNETAVKLQLRAGPGPGEKWTNSLGMRFVPIGPNSRVLFCVWETRWGDYSNLVTVGSAWKTSFPERYGGSAKMFTDPVVMVSYRDAQAFCKRLTDQERLAGKLDKQLYRLPTDVEWSQAVGLSGEKGATPKARHDAASRNVFPWGGTLPPPSWAGNYSEEYSSDRFDVVAPVGRFRPNPFGIYDLGGNVWEWCGEEIEPGSGKFVVRGGSWRFDNPSEKDNLIQLTSGYRGAYPADTQENHIGFRCVIEIPER